MGAVFAFSQSLAESKKAPSKYGYAFLLKIPESIILNLFTWIPTYKFLIITAIWRIMQYDTHK